jgi:putative component of toxin-antitoxin plasmid stabilization module
MVKVRAYIDANGNKPFTQWFSELDSSAAAKVTTAVTRIELGNFSNVKGVGAGVLNTKSTLAPATGFTLAKRATSWSSS